VVLLACCAAAVSAREQVSRDFQKSVALAGGRTLRIEHSMGNITIHTHASGEVQISASIKCSSSRADEAREGCDRIKIEVDESGSGVRVRTEYPSSDFFARWHNLSYSVNYDITMPETAALELRNRFGAVSVTDLHAPASIDSGNGKVLLTGGHGRQRIENSFGDVEVTHCDGDVTIVNTNGQVTANDIGGALDVRNHFGGIRATGIGRRVDINAGNADIAVSGVGGPVAVTDSFGKVTVRDAKADVTVQNQNGPVEVTGVTGTADLRNSFDSVRFSRIARDVTVHAQNSHVTGDTVGGSAVLDTSFGGIDLHGVVGGAKATAGNSNIRLTDIGGEVYAKTSFEGVTVEDVAGPITVDNQSGSVTVRAKAVKKCAPIALNTSFGPIKLVVAQGVGYDVTAKTSFGQIRSEPAITVSGPLGGDSQVSGKIAGGGCQIRLMDQSGSIDIVN
jgi:DUF4097 and DUF4098 domain-containing protein YvlB